MPVNPIPWRPATSSLSTTSHRRPISPSFKPMNPKPETLHPQLSTLSLNPKSSIQNPKTQFLNKWALGAAGHLAQKFSVLGFRVWGLGFRVWGLGSGNVLSHCRPFTTTNTAFASHPTLDTSEHRRQPRSTNLQLYPSKKGDMYQLLRV